MFLKSLYLPEYARTATVLVMDTIIGYKITAASESTYYYYYNPLQFTLEKPINFEILNQTKEDADNNHLYTFFCTNSLLILSLMP